MSDVALSDEEIQRRVLAELDWDPEVEAIEFSVTVENGIVTLRGIVESYAKKLAAERAVLRVRGVRAVANDLVVQEHPAITDTELAKEIVRALDALTRVRGDQIQVSVKDGIVTLRGEVDWQFQRQVIVDAVRSVRGVRGLVTEITVKQPVLPGEEIRKGIEDALIRSAELDAQRIHVDVRDGEVILTGTVRSHAERQIAEAAAWRSPGVRAVTNRIEVRPV
ncbi:MAG: ornithine aminotransferase [Chloroflexota bacterium]